MTIKHVDGNTYEFRKGRQLLGVAEVSEDGQGYFAGRNEDLSDWLHRSDPDELANQLSKARKYGGIRV